jgi:hypothetical protein
MEENDKNKIKENITDQFIFHYYMHIKHANVLKRMKILIAVLKMYMSCDSFVGIFIV